MQCTQNIALLFLIIFTQHHSLDAKIPKIFTKKNIMMITTLCSLATTIFTFAYFKRSINLLKTEIQDLKYNAGKRLRVRYTHPDIPQELDYVLKQFPTKEHMQNEITRVHSGNNFDTLKKRTTEENLAILKDVMKT